MRHRLSVLYLCCCNPTTYGGVVFLFVRHSDRRHDRYPKRAAPTPAQDGLVIGESSYVVVSGAEHLKVSVPLTMYCFKPDGFKQYIVPLFIFFTEVIIIAKIFNRFTVFELVFIAAMAALGIAVKPIVVPLVHMITGPLLIPGGSVAGGIYMLWIVLAVSLINKTGAGTLVSAVQAIMVIASGVYGSHGIMSLFTYLLPGLAADAAAFLLSRCPELRLKMFFCGMAANLTGTLLSNLLFFRLPAIPLMLTLCAGALSGGLGGLVAYAIHGRLVRLGLFHNRR